MKERGILFSSAMVRAILDGRKTQTRRLVTVPWHKGKRCAPYEPWWGEEDGRLLGMDDAGDYHPAERMLAGYGTAGDRLWVRETWYDDNASRADEPRPSGPDQYIHYRADGEAHEQFEDCELFRWRPAIHMPRWASRITLEIKDVRVERLNDISGDDAAREGIALPRCGCEVCMRSAAMCTADASAHVEEFARLWDQINGKRAPWSSNPWVWVLSFSRSVAGERLSR